MDDCTLTAWRPNNDGYGYQRVDGVWWLAHRWAWTLTHGPIPPGMCVLHHCDNPPCINLGHLFLGTRADNNADKDQKGRLARGAASWPSRNRDRMSRGSQLPHAKLTESDIPIIRARLERGESQSSVAADYGVVQPTIHSIAHGQSWRHV